MDRDKIFEQIENIFELCSQRNKGFNETELDIKETITDYISKNFVLCGVVKSFYCFEESMNMQLKCDSECDYCKSIKIEQ